MSEPTDLTLEQRMFILRGRSLQMEEVGALVARIEAITADLPDKGTPDRAAISEQCLAEFFAFVSEQNAHLIDEFALLRVDMDRTAPP